MSSPAKSTPVEARSDRPAGCLPQWQRQELPEPLPFTIRNFVPTIGTGSILRAR
ncbi:MAG: hypothetical protein ACK5A3_24220 [Planctomyces sp.]